MAEGDEGLEKGGDPGQGAAEGAVAGVPGERSKLAEELRVNRTPSTLVAVVIAWATTLAPAGFSRGSTLGASLMAVAALAAGLGGPVLARKNARAGRHLGISLFVALAVATWLLGAPAIHPIRLDSIRGVFGAIAWGVFALSWSDRWGPGPEAVPADPEAPLLLPRAALPFGAVPLTALAVAAALGYLVLAFRVRDPDRALLAQAVALACAVGVVTAAGIVATARGKRRPTGGRRLTPPVVRALLLLCAVAVGGAIVTALRR
ncbi:MAG: hypothetical protein QM820_05760 [Minicystis sp.]